MDNNKQSPEQRIVSLSQPHIRPRVREKAEKKVEFGAKLSASCFEGYVFLDRISWDSFNEAGNLKAQVEAYHRFTGYYPESVHAVSEALEEDLIYRTTENRAWCKEKGIIPLLSLLVENFPELLICRAFALRVQNY